jgi:hypothetical protein
MLFFFFGFEIVNHLIDFARVCLLKLAGVVAVEVTGGPEIPFPPGRPVSEPQYSQCFHFIELYVLV